MGGVGSNATLNKESLCSKLGRPAMDVGSRLNRAYLEVGDSPSTSDAVGRILYSAKDNKILIVDDNQIREFWDKKALDEAGKALKQKVESLEKAIEKFEKQSLEIDKKLNAIPQITGKSVSDTLTIENPRLPGARSYVSVKRSIVNYQTIGGYVQCQGIAYLDIVADRGSHTFTMAFNLPDVAFKDPIGCLTSIGSDVDYYGMEATPKGSDGTKLNIFIDQKHTVIGVQFNFMFMAVV